jgi:hypothetical protein
MFVDQASQDRSALDPLMAEVHDGIVRPGRTELAGTVRSTAVVVPDELREHRSQVSLPEDQHAVGEFGSGGQHEPLGEAVRPRAARRNLHYRDAHVGQDRVERCGGLAGSIADEEPELGGAVTKVQDKVAGLLGSPRARSRSLEVVDLHVR